MDINGIGRIYQSLLQIDIIEIEYTYFSYSQKDNVLECAMLLLPAKVMSFLSRREKKAAGLEQHKKLERERPEKKREETGFAYCKASEREEIVAFGFGK